MPVQTNVTPIEEPKLLQPQEIPQKDITTQPQTTTIDADLAASSVLDTFLAWLENYDDGQFAPVTRLTQEVLQRVGSVKTTTELADLLTKYQTQLFGSTGKHLISTFPKIMRQLRVALNKVIWAIEMIHEQGGPATIQRHGKKTQAEVLNSDYKPQTSAPHAMSFAAPEMTVETQVEDVDNTVDVGPIEYPTSPETTNQDSVYLDRTKNYLTKGLDNLLKVQHKPGGLKQVTEQLMAIVRKLEKRYSK